MSGRAQLAILALAGIAGAAGVSLAAVAAHRVTTPALATAATMLIIHAAAAVAIASLARQQTDARLWTGVAALMLFGIALFSGDIAANALGGFHLFPLAAPIGGSTLIASWISLALVAMLTALRER